MLGSRLFEIAELVLEQLRPPRSVPLDELMGGRIDAVKQLSSLTLFELVALQMRVSLDAAVAARAAGLADCCRDVLDIAGRQGFPACAFTLRLALTGGG